MNPRKVHSQSVWWCLYYPILLHYNKITIYYYIPRLPITYIWKSNIIYNIFFSLDLRISAPKCPDTSKWIHILREPIKMRLVHGPTSWILGDDSPINCHCFFFIPVWSLLLLSISVHWQMPTLGWPKPAGFWKTLVSAEYSIAQKNPPWDQTLKSRQISPNQIILVEAKGKSSPPQKKVRANTTVTFA